MKFDLEPNKLPPNEGYSLPTFKDDGDPYLVNGVFPAQNYNDVKNRLHANYVRRSINSRQNSYVLRRASPPVHSSDKRLPRAYRSILA